MRPMKEKLVKNHYKGFDKRMKICGITSACLMLVSVCTFVPLMASLQANIQEAQAQVEAPKVETNKEAVTLIIK